MRDETANRLYTRKYASLDRAVFDPAHHGRAIAESLQQRGRAGGREFRRSVSYREVLLFSIGAFYELQECSVYRLQMI